MVRKRATPVFSEARSFVSELVARIIDIVLVLRLGKSADGAEAGNARCFKLVGVFGSHAAKS